MGETACHDRTINSKGNHKGVRLCSDQDACELRQMNKNMMSERKKSPHHRNKNLCSAQGKQLKKGCLVCESWCFHVSAKHRSDVQRAFTKCTSKPLGVAVRDDTYPPTGFLHKGHRLSKLPTGRRSPFSVTEGRAPVSCFPFLLLAAPNAQDLRSGGTIGYRKQEPCFWGFGGYCLFLEKLFTVTQTL